MINPTQVTGVILAGGLARRMNHQDKGLVYFQGRPLISFAIDALSQVTPQLLINANRNHEHYQAFGFPVIADQNDSFDGPLAGLFTAMLNTDAKILLVMPCDSPLVKAEHLQKLLNTLLENTADVAVAFDGKRLHPVFLAIKTSLKSSLQDYLDCGQRKLDRWLAEHTCVIADFSDQPDIFVNINTVSELAELEHPHD